jgi:hypothetical protein
MFSSAKEKNGFSLSSTGNADNLSGKQSSGIRAGAIAAGAPKEPRKPRDRPGSSAFSELQAAREIRPDFEEKIHEKHGPRAEKLKRFGVGACK